MTHAKTILLLVLIFTGGCNSYSRLATEADDPVLSRLAAAGNERPVTTLRYPTGGGNAVVNIALHETGDLSSPDLVVLLHGCFADHRTWRFVAGDLGRTWTRSDRYPLKGIFGIHKTDTTMVSPMSTSQTVALLVASAPYLNTDTQRLTDLLANIHKLAQSVPCGVLGFRTDQDCWPEIRGPGRSSPRRPQRPDRCCG